MANKAVFLDRDGTINVDVGYAHKLEELKIISGVIEGLKELQELDYKLIIVTNQAGIGRGYYTKEDYHDFQLKLRQELNKQGIFITEEYFCPHHPEKGIGEYKKNCNCRKPKTGMLEQASNDFNIDLTQSWLIGDKPGDIQAGNSAGCKTILVKTGKAGEDRHFSIAPTFTAYNLLEAADYIIKEDENK